MKLFDSNLDIQDHIRTLKRRKYYFLLPFMLVLLIGIFKITTRTPEYESYCVVQITPTQLPSNLQRVVPKVTYYQRAVSLKMQILNSPNLLKIIERLRLDEDQRIREKALQMKSRMPDKNLNEIIQFLLLKNLQKQMKVRTFGDDFIEIRVTDRDPEFAYNKVKTILDIFMEEFIERELTSIQKVKEFNYQQLEIYKKELEESERRLSEYKKELIVGQDTKSKILSRDALDRINEAMVAIDLSVREQETYLKNLKRQLTSRGQRALEKFPRTPAINNYYSEIRMKINQLAELMKHYTWKSSEVITVNKSIIDLRENISIELEKYFRNSFPTLDAQTLHLMNENAMALLDLEIANRKKEVMNQIITASKYSTSTSQANELTQAKLEEAVQINRDLYNLFLQQIQGTQIEESIQRVNEPSRFNIVEPPIKPLEPTNAGITLHILLTMVFALMAGLGTVYFREFHDKSIRTVEEVEELFEIPVIGVIPYLENEPFVHINSSENSTIQSEKNHGNITKQSG